MSLILVKHKTNPRIAVVVETNFLFINTRKGFQGLSSRPVWLQVVRIELHRKEGGYIKHIEVIPYFLKKFKKALRISLKFLQALYDNMTHSQQN